MATEDAHLDPEEEEGGPVKPFLDHLEDLRWVLIKSLSALGIAMAACMGGAPYLVSLLTWPKDHAGLGINIEWLGPMGGVTASMKIAFWGGLLLALPFILYFVGQFVLPALKSKEKRYFMLAFGVGGGLFIFGVVICYFFVLSLSLSGMASYNRWLGIHSSVWRAEDYFQFVIALMLGMGLSFELPLLLLTLVRLEILPHDWLVKGRKYFFFINFVACAFITPDFLSTFILVVPTQILLEICIWISRSWDKQKQIAAKLAEPPAPAQEDGVAPSSD